MTKKQKWFALTVLLLVPSLVLAGAISVEVGGFQYLSGLTLTAPSGTALTLSGGNAVMGTGTVSTTTASGNNAFAVSTNGARVDFGAGASDYASSDGTTVAFAGSLQSSGLFTASTGSTHFGATNLALNAYLYNSTASRPATVNDAEGLAVVGVTTENLATCNNTAPPGGTRGTIQYDISTTTFKYCNGTGWGTIDTDTVPASTTCTNQFVRAVNGASAATCATVSLTADVTGTLPIAQGGTGTTTVPIDGGIVYGASLGYASTGQGTTGQCLQSAGANAPTWDNLCGAAAASGVSGYINTSAQYLGSGTKTVGGIQVGTGGSAVTEWIRGTVTIDIASTAAGACAADVAVTATGAVGSGGEECSVGVPPAAAVAGAVFWCWASGADAALIRMCCVAGTCNPDSTQYSVRITGI